MISYHNRIVVKAMTANLKKGLAVLVVGAALMVTGGALLHVSVQRTNSIAAAVASRGQKIIIDAGHGGFDGGAVSGSLMEKDFNLAIAAELRDILSQKGYCILMTRESDTALSDGSGTSAKKQDMRKRRAIMEENPDAIFLSIHMNKFEDSVCKGAQVFYGAQNPRSEELAVAIQDSIKKELQPDNHRLAKQAGKSIYLLRTAAIPAVIVECGFLSNPQDADHLSQPEYRAKMANAIADGLELFLKSDHTGTEVKENEQ